VSFKFCVKFYIRRELRALRLGHCGVETRVSTLASSYCSDAEMQKALRLGTAVMLRRGFQALYLGTALVAMISLAPGIWTLLSDDLSSVIFGQSAEPLQNFQCSVVDWDGFRNTLDFD